MIFAASEKERRMTMPEKYIKATDCEKYFYEHLDDVHIAAAMNAIDEMPAADVAPVVRCKDCKYLEISGCYGECGKGYLGIVRPDCYCCYGERRIDNG